MTMKLNGIKLNFVRNEYEYNKYVSEEYKKNTITRLAKAVCHGLLSLLIEGIRLKTLSINVSLHLSLKHH